MTQPALNFFTRRALASKLQDAEGTPVTPSTSTNGVVLYDGSSGTEHDEITDNRDKAFFSGDEITVTNERGFVEGTFRLYPPTTPGDASAGTPDCNVILLPGGMTKVLDAAARTTRYNPISEAIAVATHYWWQSGTHKQLYDARNQISSLMMEVGKRFEGRVRIQGTIQSIEDEALPSVTTSDTRGLVITAANSIGTVKVLPSGDTINVWAKNLTVDFGSELKTEEFTELKVNSINNRKGSYKFKLARTSLADFDPWVVKSAGSFVQIVFRAKQSDHRYEKLAIRGQIKDISEVDIDGKYGWELSGPCVASSAGGDEFYTEFGDVSLRLTGELSDGTDDVVYSGTTALTVDGEYDTPLAYTISVGTLPPGLSIHATTGVVSGTPTTADTYNFTVRAESADGQVATRAQTVIIGA